MKAFLKKHNLRFRFHAATSRGILREKDVWYLVVKDEAVPGVFGVGEAAPLKGLSIDDRPDLEAKLVILCRDLEKYGSTELHEANLEDIFQLKDFPTVLMALETALLDLANGGKRTPFPSSFSEGERSIPINGLIWMGDMDYMLDQIEKKLEDGYSCIKMKIGAIDFKSEVSLMEHIRNKFTEEQITIRVDANGAYTLAEALEKLKILSTYKIHSVEQPIGQGQFKEMAELCATSAIPVALDEELIGIAGMEQKEELLSQLKPPYIILKPSLIGGFKSSQEWIRLAEKYGIGWWMTSALESNIGLNALAQFTATLDVKNFPQGLGTGQIYMNNIDSPLVISSGSLSYKPQLSWEMKGLF